MRRPRAFRRPTSPARFSSSNSELNSSRPGTGPAMPALRIVVAEDDAAIRELLVHHLTREGFRCTETSDGPSTLRAVRAGTDLVILDIGLPVVDGFDVVRTLRREGRGLPGVVGTR